MYMYIYTTMGIPFEKACALHSHLHSKSALTHCMRSFNAIKQIFFGRFSVLLYLLLIASVYSFFVCIYVHVDDVRKERETKVFLNSTDNSEAGVTRQQQNSQNNGMNDTFCLNSIILFSSSLSLSSAVAIIHKYTITNTRNTQPLDRLNACREQATEPSSNNSNQSNNEYDKAVLFSPRQSSNVRCSTCPKNDSSVFIHLFIFWLLLLMLLLFCCFFHSIRFIYYFYRTFFVLLLLKKA